MAVDGRDELFQAVKAHISALEIAWKAASEADRAVLGRRLENSRLLLEWISAIFPAGGLVHQAPSPPAVADPDGDATPGRSPPKSP